MIVTYGKCVFCGEEEKISLENGKCYDCIDLIVELGEKKKEEIIGRKKEIIKKKKRLF